MHDDGIYNNHQPEHSGAEEFLTTASATFAGAYLGHLIDQTRFGVWFNNNRTIDRIFTAIKLIAVLAALVLVVWFFVILFTQP